MPLKKTLNDFADEARADVKEISVEELMSLGNSALIIDVRELDEHTRASIPNAIHIPRGVIERDIEKLAFGGKVEDKDLARPIVCYCGGGSRSILAAKSLKQMGFSEAVSLKGGFAAWRQAGIG